MSTMTSQEKRVRRSEEQLIADLEARIAELKVKAVQKKAQRDPSLKHLNKAIKFIDVAASECEDNAMKKALADARLTLSACLSLNGVIVPVGTRVRRTTQMDLAGKLGEESRTAWYIDRTPSGEPPPLSAHVRHEGIYWFAR